MELSAVARHEGLRLALVLNTLTLIFVVEAWPCTHDLVLHVCSG